MNRLEIIDNVNKRDFKIVLKGKKYDAKVSGNKLEFPIIFVKDNVCISSEISWKLVERLLSGEVKEVNF